MILIFIIKTGQSGDWSPAGAGRSKMSGKSQLNIIG